MTPTVDAAALKAHARGCDFDLVGVADPTQVGLPAGLAWCRAVIVLGYANPDETLDVCYRTTYEGVRKWSKWIYEIVDVRAGRVCAWLRRRGFRATFTRNGAQIDLKKAAVLAGLGTLGRNNLLLSPRFGPRLRLVAVFTNAPLPCDPRLPEALCHGCDRCVSACPFGALSAAGFDRPRCVGGLGGFDQPPHVLERQRQVERRIGDCTFIQCIRCMRACPIGEE
jgi:epoxyqueuosine reductase QueG